MSEVVISGAGPNGLMLACELALAGVRPIVLETTPAPVDRLRANGVVGEIVRLLDRRGLYERITGEREPPRPRPGFTFAAFPLDLHDLHDNPLYTLPVPQHRLEQVLGERATELKVEIRRPHELTGLRQDDNGVTISVRGPDGYYELSASYLVGADGGHSAVRKLAGIGFPGVTDDRSVSRSAHVGVPPGSIDPATGGLRVPGYGVIPPLRHHRTERGMIVWATLPGRPPMLSTTEWPLDRAAAEDGPLSIEELAASAARVLGAEVEIGPPAGDGPFLLRRGLGGNTRLAERYRDRRVLLVGDAAHVHAAIGGPGLNIGLRDAVNLGWKLAATVRGWAPHGLLDTYESERRPAAERVTMHTQAQTLLTMPGSEVTALRRLFGELLDEPAVRRRIAALLAGADSPGPDLPRAQTCAARAFVLDPTGSLHTVAAPWRDRVDVLAAPHLPDALLVRPDCEVAWTGPDGLTAALARWFGAPLPA